ncbi:MAG: methyltransferase domain-containing protein [Minisyncoccia bacterium]
MTYAILDIGAGDKKFARALKKENKHIEMLVLCGEPESVLRCPSFWDAVVLGDSWDRVGYFRNLFRRPISQVEIARFLNEGNKGVHFIEAAYESFNLPDNSLDLVTLNSPHPFSPPGVGMKVELLRCLKPGGLFFSSFPLCDVAKIPESFIKIEEGRWGAPGSIVRLMEEQFPDFPFRAFPQSPVLESNIRAHQRNPHRGNIVSYIYSNGIKPRWQVWRKPL